MGLLLRVSQRLRRLAHEKPRAGVVDTLGELRLAEELHRAGKLREASVLYEHILETDPEHAQATYFLGLVRFQEGDAGGASDLIERASFLGLDTPQVRTNLGLVYMHLGRFEVAERALREAIRQDPAFASAHGTLALVRARIGDLHGAVLLLEKACELEPQNVEALNNLGGIYRDLGRLDDALARFGDALRLRPDSVAILSNLAGAQMASRQWSDAAATFRRVIALDDRLPLAWSGMGGALAEMGEYGDAESACREALQLRPDAAEGLAALARVLRHQGKADEAEPVLRRLLELDPGQSTAWGQMAAVHAARFSFEEAEASHRRAVDLAPRSASARFDLAHFLLGQGKYEEGFALFESRFLAIPGWFTDEVRAAGQDESEHRWRGQALDDKHLLVLGEQGFGDQIMMFRYLPLLKQRGARRVSLTCAPELLRLARAITGVDQVFDRTDRSRPEGVDIVVPAMSLPYCFRSTIDTLPDAGYLGIDANQKHQWAERLASLEGLRVGLTWAGNSTQDDLLRRTLTLETLRPLLGVAGATLVSLQKPVPGQAQCEDVRGELLTDPIDACEDFFDTACLVSNLELVITVDTAVAHLAATLGVPTWLLLKTGGEWRWGPTSATSAWYPDTMRIFRQGRGASWSELVEQVADALRKEVQVLRNHTICIPEREDK